MANLFIYGNNSSSTMASGITNVQTTVTVQPGQGALFPAPSAGQQLAVTFEDVAGVIEVAYCTGITGDVLTVVRGQEGTTAVAFASGSRVEGRLTKGMLQQLLQKTGGDTLTGTTNLSGVLAMGGAGSIQGGEVVSPLRGVAGQTTNQISVPASGPATSGGSPILTTGNITANLPAGYGLTLTNMVLMWNGSSGSVPTGYHVCDGTTGTPDLRDRFVVGAGTTYALGANGGSAATSTGSTDPFGQMSIGGHTLTVAEMPAHAHDFKVSDAVGYAGGPNPPFTIPMWSSSSTPTFHTNVPAGASGGANSALISNTGGGASHTHGLSGNLAHVHSYTLPPYYALFYIMKT